MRRQVPDPFARVRAAGLALPRVEEATRYDGSPVLRMDGVFVAGLATHASAEPGTLVVRADIDTRAGYLEDAPEAYHLTAYYKRHPVLLVRLDRVDDVTLRDLLATSYRLTLPKVRRRTRAR